ncbi:MAG: hypothetical protein H6707_09710 [Deltaproteobacteria bacterium]|nr:hypothetical protein [Deltaproteobacteria bacterium]
MFSVGELRAQSTLDGFDPPREPRREYGVFGGVASALAPTEAPGAVIGLSAAQLIRRTGLQQVWARGTLWGSYISQTDWTFSPILSTDAGAVIGERVEIYGMLGAQLFGFARRQHLWAFAPIGLTAGVMVGVRVTSGLSVRVRGSVLWLPGRTTAAMNDIGDLGRPDLVWVFSGLELAWR